MAGNGVCCVSGARRGRATLDSAALFATLLPFLLFNAVAGSEKSEVLEAPPLDEVVSYLSNGSAWLWSNLEDPEAASNVLTYWLSSWCGATWKDASENAASKSKELERLQRVREKQYKELIECRLEKTSAEQDLQRECVKQQKVDNATFARERAILQAEFSRERAELRADLESCELRTKRRVEAVCDRDAAKAQAETVEELASLKAVMQANEQQMKVTDEGRCAALEVEVMQVGEQRKVWDQERERLVAEVAACRPAKAQAEARLKALLADGTLASLESTVKWQWGLLLLLLVLFTASSAAVLYFIFQQDSHGSSVGSPNRALAALPAQLRLLTAEQARDELQEIYERRQGYGVPLILTTNSEAEGVPSVVFLLVPLNVSSSRRFALFGGGGDYTGHVERAQEFVSKVAPKARLVVVLYEYAGCVFTEQTLRFLRMTADKVADEAVPRDADFPRRSDIVVLWLHAVEGLYAANSEGGSELIASLKAQPWAEYLLSRSGRWGDFSKS